VAKCEWVAAGNKLAKARKGVCGDARLENDDSSSLHRGLISSSSSSSSSSSHSPSTSTIISPSTSTATSSSSWPPALSSSMAGEGGNGIRSCSLLSHGPNPEILKWCILVTLFYQLLVNRLCLPVHFHVHLPHYACATERHLGSQAGLARACPYEPVAVAQHRRARRQRRASRCLQVHPRRDARPTFSLRGA
jgi:hypothetical protein